MIIFDELKKYKEENPNLLNEEEKSRLTHSVNELLNAMYQGGRLDRVGKAKALNSMLADDYLMEFLIHIKTLVPSPIEDVARRICSIYPVKEYPKLLDVASGRCCKLALELSKKGYEVTAIDPDIRLTPEDERYSKIRILKQEFDKEFDVSAYDAIVGFNACPVAKALLNVKEKPVMFSICDAPQMHDKLDIGIDITSKEEFINALKEQGASVINLNDITIIDNSRILNKNKSSKIEDKEIER